MRRDTNKTELCVRSSTISSPITPPCVYVLCCACVCVCVRQPGTTSAEQQQAPPNNSAGNANNKPTDRRSVCENHIHTHTHVRRSFIRATIILHLVMVWPSGGAASTVPSSLINIHTHTHSARSLTERIRTNRTHTYAAMRTPHSTAYTQRRHSICIQHSTAGTHSHAHAETRAYSTLKSHRSN